MLDAPQFEDCATAILNPAGQIAAEKSGSIEISRPVRDKARDWYLSVLPVLKGV
jgi:hypothetical protein